jgi:hypothetical protein
MRSRDALRRAVGYHLRAFVPTVAGLGVAGAGLWYGFVGAASLRPSALLASGRALPVAAAVGVGVALAAVGRTATRLDATAGVVADEVDAVETAEVDVDELREDLAVAVRQAVADSHELTAADLESLVETTVDRAVADAVSDRRPDRRASVDATFADDALDEGEFARHDDGRSGPDPLAEASERANDRVESFLHGADTDDAETVGEHEAGDGEMVFGAEIEDPDDESDD